MGRKTIREEIRKKEVALIRAETMIKELRTTVNAKNHEMNKLQNLINSGDISKKELEESHRAKAKDLDEKIIENQSIKKELAAKGEEQRTMDLLLSQKDRELDSLKKAMQIEKRAFEIKLEEKEEELKSMRFFVKEKDKDIEDFCEALEKKGQELNDKLSEKNLEISEINANLMAERNELLLVKNRTVWQQLKACLLSV